jgi:hypothetical protein
MMDGAHPNELDLLAYVEEDLPEPRKAAVAEHVAGCQACADSVRRLETARQVLRSAPPLELPAGSRAGVLAGLRARAPRRRLRWRPALVPALAAAAVLVVVTGVVLTVDGNGGGQEEAGEAVAPAEQATSEAGAGAEEPEQDDTRALSSALRSVQGPPRDVALYLRRQGFDARVVDSSVRVRNADPDAVMRALADRPDGPVVVEVVP